MKKSEAMVTIGAGAHLLADYMVGIYATAVSDASGQAASQLFSVGYSQADAIAKITVESGAKIEGRTGPVNITSDATATAEHVDGDEREEQGQVPGQRGAQFAISLAVSWANVISQTTMAPDRRGPRLRARSTSARSATSESEAEADVDASSRTARRRSPSRSSSRRPTSWPRSTGKVTADMATNGGEVVKFEFDPTVPAANFESDQTIKRLLPRSSATTPVSSSASRASRTTCAWATPSR